MKRNALLCGMVVFGVAAMMWLSDLNAEGGCCGSDSASAGGKCLMAAATTGPAQSQPAGKSAVVNNRCPIMGGAVDPATVPASLTRQYKGQTVGFCCGACPGQWDKLSDADKDAKLAKVTAAAK